MDHNKASDNDKEQLDRITGSFFSVFTNKNNEKINLNRVRAICIPEVLIIKKTGLTQVIYNMDSFIEPREKILSDGTLTEFEEKEIEEQTQIVGHLAQRRSKYSKSGYLSNSYFTHHGNKLFQFIMTEAGWKISACIWEDE